MRIAGSDLHLGVQHQFGAQHQRSEQLQSWVGKRPPAPAAVAAPTEKRGNSTGEGQAMDLAKMLEKQAKALNAAKALGKPAEAAEATPAKDAVSPEDAKVKRILTILEKTFGMSDLKAVSLDLSFMHMSAVQQSSSATAASGQGQAGWGMAYDSHESYTEYEAMQMSASGVVQTADGKQFTFSLDVLQERLYHEERSVSVRAGDAAATDPLMLATDGGPARLSPIEKMLLDLDGDGRPSAVARPQVGTWFLVNDRNRDGTVNDRNELFGPATGQGFGELGALDGDGNGFVDAGDSAWKNLRLWDGFNALRTLSAAGIGALGVANVDAPFRHTDDQNRTLGQGHKAGLYLTENGKAGALQQIDLVG